MQTAASVRRGPLRLREAIAGVALALLVAVIPTPVQQSNTHSPAASVGSGEPHGSAVLAIGNWPDPM